MRERTRILLLVLVMSTVAVVGVLVALATLYSTAVELQQQRLREIVRSRAVTIEAIAEHERHRLKGALPASELERLTFEETMGQIRRAHDRFAGFGTSGEFTMAQGTAGQIVFLLRHRHNDLDTPAPVSVTSALAEPMRRAISGRAGTMVGLDYRGEVVLAAYQPVRLAGLGLVAKVDLAEVRRPFIRIGALSLGFVLIFILLGTGLALRIGKPIISTLERQKAQLKVEVKERRAAAVEMQEAKAFLDTIVDMSPLPMWVSDPDGLIIRTNRALCETLGLKDSDIVGKYRVLEDANLESQGVMPRVRAVYEDFEPTHFNIYWEARQAGEVAFEGARDLYIDVSMFPIIDHRGKLEHVVCQWADVSERVRAVNELRELSSTLERRVHERTTDLEAANRELAGFAYSVSHDLRAPLRAISGFAQIIGKRFAGDLPQQGRHYFDNVVEASQRMERLIDDLLRYARMGQKGVELVPLEIGPTLRRVQETLSDRIRESGAVITVSPDPVQVLANETLLVQILLNLLENAIKYHSPGQPPRIGVAWSEREGRVVLQVSDDGIGIQERFHEKIFRVFQRLHPVEEYPGTGIGLALVAKAAMLARGTVRLESEKGQGSTFFVSLERAREGQEEEVHPEE